MTIDVTFHGLCAFARQGKRFDALLLPEGGDHKPILTIPVVQFRIKDTTMAPATVGHDQSGNEIAMWDLQGITIKIGTNSADPTFANPNVGFALGLYHPAATPKKEAELEAEVGTKGSKIQLTSGSLSFEKMTLKLIVKKETATIITGVFPSAVRWHGEASAELVFLKGGSAIGKIVLKNIPEIPIDFSITNVARTDFDEGLTHFTQYYKLINLGSGDKELTLKNNEADIDVFDCVPPVALPEA